MTASTTPPDSRRPQPVGLAITLIVAGAIGWIAAFALTLERLASLEKPGDALSCDFGTLVQCSANLDSWQGSLLGFPNPLIGLAGWIAPIVTGAAVLAGARFARWYWWLFTLGMTGAMALVIWLITQSIFVLGTLCPWCMVTWAVTIPSFFAIWFFVVREGIVPAPGGARRTARMLSGWLALVTFACYLIIAIVAQVRLDVIGNIGL
ncbi:vitamin K epoxide reductase family protein [Okibacterium endophyticum]